jgi:hypothetical protein
MCFMHIPHSLLCHLHIYVFRDATFSQLILCLIKLVRFVYALKLLFLSTKTHLQLILPFSSLFLQSNLLILGILSALSVVLV